MADNIEVLRGLVAKFRSAAKSHEIKADRIGIDDASRSWHMGASEMAGDCADELDAAIDAMGGEGELAEVEQVLLAYALRPPGVSTADAVRWALQTLHLAVPAEQGGEAVAPFLLGRKYKTQAGDPVVFVSIHNPGTDHETMADAEGVHRYTRRVGDMGRVTGSPHDFSDPRNVPPLYTAAPKVAGGVTRGSRKLDPLACAKCRTGFTPDGESIYAPLDNVKGFAVCPICNGSYGEWGALTAAHQQEER